MIRCGVTGMARKPEFAHEDWVWTRNKVLEALARYTPDLTVAGVQADVAWRLTHPGPGGPTAYRDYATRWGLEQLAAVCAKVSPGDTVGGIRPRLNDLVDDPRHPGYREA